MCARMRPFILEAAPGPKGKEGIAVRRGVARCEFAEWTPIAATTRQPGDHIKTQVILHTLVARARDVIDDWRRTNSLESTFIVALDGHIFQCMDSAHRADANRNANSRAISIETEDYGAAADSDPDKRWIPWTSEQLASLYRLITWCHTAHGIPLQRCADPESPGVGYHSMWGTPSPWTPVVKSCPGPARVRQFDESIQAFLEGREPPDQAAHISHFRQPVREVPLVVRQRLIVDDTHYLAPPPSRARRRAPTAGRRR